MNRTLLSGAAALLLTLAAKAQGTRFLPGHLAVLRAGSGAVALNLKSAPIFLDQFDPKTPGNEPSFTVPIPANGTNGFFFNGHAATEGNLTRSDDHKLLVFAGYGGLDLHDVNGTASRLGIKRGFCTVDGAGMTRTFLYRSETPIAKANPRGGASDGSNNFWGCGNASGTLYYNPSEAHKLVRFNALPNSRAIKIINHILYTTLNAADANAGDQSAGIYSFLPVALPRQADLPASLAVAAATNYTKVVGFDINTNGDIAYMCDTAAGIQRFVKAGGAWKFDYNFSIPQNIPKDLNNAVGCFGLAVDFGAAAPVIYATTTEGYGNCVNSNRVVRIVDTNSAAVVTTLVQAASTNIAYRGIDFTPE